MRKLTLAFSTLTVVIAGGVIASTSLLQPTSSTKAQTPEQSQAQMDALRQKQTQTQGRTCYPPEYTPSGDLVLPKNFHEWIFVGEPFTPNALNGGMANFPEFHNVYMEPCSYEKYQQTNVFPEGTIFFKELQLTQPSQFPDGSRTEPSGRGYFPGAFNGADATVKDSKRYGASGTNWGFYNFNHYEPKAPTAKVKAVSECAFCHISLGAKKDEVWTQFYRILDH